MLPLAALAAALMYQSTNPAIYYVAGMAVLFWGYSEGEVCDNLYFMCYKWLGMWFGGDVISEVRESIC